VLIAIEASAAMTGHRTGVGQYTAHLMGELERIGGDDVEFVYFSNRRDATGLDQVVPGAEQAHYPRNGIRSRLVWLQVGIPRSIRQIEPDVCHFPNQLLPVVGRRSVPTVVTIHDAAVFRHPRTVRTRTLAVHRALLAAARYGRTLIVTPTRSVRDEIVDLLSLPPDRVFAVPEGVAPAFTPSREAEDDVIVRSYGLHEPYVLSVGTLEPRKNHARLIQAFTQMVAEDRSPHHLVLVGDRGWKDDGLLTELRQHPLADRIHLPGYVPREHLPALYRSAAVFAFPSLYEGFGLPVAEALACGTPVLISTDPALCEVAANAAVRANPLSVDEIAAGLHALLHNTPLRARLSTAGVERARRLTWTRCAAGTLAVYREALSLA
jgi:glycosyltransferase involved in cell wall biosynthesis